MSFFLKIDGIPGSSFYVGGPAGALYPSTLPTKGQLFVGTASGVYGPVTGGGDLTWSTGTAGSATVVAVQGNTVTSGALVKGDLFIATTTSNWASVAVTGDVGFSASTPGLTVVSAINGATVPAAGSLTTGNGLYVSGSSALSYSALNLAGGSNYVTGALPVTNFAHGTAAQVLITNSGATAPAWVSLSGDITTTAAGGTTLGAITGIALPAPTGTNTVLTYTGSALTWGAGGGGGGFTAGGDLSGTSSSQTVVGIQSQPVSATAVTKGQFFMGTAAGSYGPVSGSGDVTWSAATAGSSTVTGLQSIAVPSPSGTNTVLQYNSGAYTWAVGAGVSYTIQPIYGTSNQSITCTINSLANSATAARASTVIDNSSTLAEDIMVFVTIASNATTGTSATGYIAVYAYGTVDGGSNYTENATGSDAGLTLTSPTNAPLVATINVVANAKTYKAGPFSLRQAFGLDRVPQKVGIIIVNQSGATLATSGNSAIYQVVNGKLV